MRVNQLSEDAKLQHFPLAHSAWRAFKLRGCGVARRECACLSEAAFPASTRRPERRAGQRRCHFTFHPRFCLSDLLAPFSSSPGPSKIPRKNLRALVVRRCVMA